MRGAPKPYIAPGLGQPSRIICVSSKVVGGHVQYGPSNLATPEGYPGSQEGNRGNKSLVDLMRVSVAGALTSVSGSLYLS